MQGDLDASLKSGIDVFGCAIITFHQCILSFETFAPTLRVSLEPYGLVYSGREKTQPPLDQPNHQSNAPTISNSEVILYPKPSIDTSKERKPPSHYGFANCTVKYPFFHYVFTLLISIL